MKVYLRNLARKYLDSVGITSYHRHIVRAWVSYFIQGARKRRAKTLEFHSQFITRGDLVFDVGAHIGERTSLYLSLGAEVLAIEPQADCAAFLRKRFRNNKHVSVLQKAVSDQEGEETLFISDANTISSMSVKWMRAVSESGRFSQHNWNATTRVPTITLDALIRDYGMPSFTKIDTEGYEQKVLMGLSHPIKALSFEFTPEVIEDTLHCIGLLASYPAYVFNYLVGESMEFALSAWVNEKEICELITKVPDDIFGDIYAKCETDQASNRILCRMSSQK